MNRSALVLAVACAATALWTAGAAAQGPPSRLAAIERPTVVSTYAGARAWSEHSGGRFRLVVAAGGERTVLPRGRGVPFDVDLGPGPRGKPVAVYSRCAREPRTTSRLGLPLIDWASGRGCDVHVWSPGARERRLPAAGAAHDEFLPSIWRGRVVFARVPSGRRRATPSLVAATTTGTRVRRLARGPSAPRRRSAVTGLDLRGADYAFGWGRPVGRGGAVTTEIHRARVGGMRTRVLDTGAGDARTAVWSPSLAGASTAWLKVVGSSVETQYHVLTRVPSGEVVAAMSTLVPLFSASHDAGATLLGTGSSARPGVPCPRSEIDGRVTCEVLASGP